MWLVMIPAAVAALGIAVIAAGCALAFRLCMLIPTEIPAASAVIVMPATGALPGLEALFAALRDQTLAPGRVIVAVESREDPAYDRAAAVSRRFPELAVELVVAGTSDRRAQKCTNILAGVTRLQAADRHVVLCDADIRPQRWWLAALVGPLAGGNADIVNGYRWPVASKVSLASLLGATIDRAVATLPRFDAWRLLWGGSLALSRTALDRIDLPATLADTLSDDLGIGTRAAELGLRIVTRRGIRAPTPLDIRLAALWRLGRRQYQIIHTYRPGLWFTALAITSTDLAARAALIVTALTGSLARPRWTAAAALLALALLGSVTVELRRRIGRRLDVVDPAGFVLCQHLLMWTLLPCVAFHTALVWAGSVRSPVTWAHVRYRVDRSGRVVGASRSAGLVGGQQQLERPRGGGRSP